MNVIRMCLKAGAILALATVANGADWYVSADMDYGADVADAAHRKDNLQSAINSAKAGDTIWVADGFVCDSGSTDVSGSAYRITSNKALIIRAENGDWRTGPTIRGSLDETAPVGGFAKTAVNAKVQIIGFNFEDCAITSGDGGGVRGNGYNGGWNLTLRSCRLSNCKASNGGGATLVEAYDCVFDGNLAKAHGGGLYYANAYGCEIANNVQTSSGSGYGGGGFYSGTASNCVFSGNSAIQGGGAESVDALRCTFLDNTSSGYGGGCKSGSARDSFFARNRAGTRGGGIHGGSSISNCVFACNTAVGYGGGRALQNTSSVVIRDCVITNNTTGETGGGISSGLYGPVLYNSLVANNVATNNGGGTFNVTLVDCVVTNNTSASGYGGGACGGRFARNCLFASNSAKCGGGICAITAADCEIVGNTAETQGGGIRGSAGQSSDMTAESLFVTNCLVAGNTVTSAAVNIGGGGAFGATLVGCVVSNNWSECWSGGGLYLCNTINTLIVGNTCAFEYNNSNRGGGGVCLGTHYNSLIAGNTSWGGGGGALSARLVNCTVVANTNASTRATLAGGCGRCNLINTVSWGNVGGSDDEFSGHVATNSISATSLSSYGPGNSTANPRLAAESRGPYVPAFGSPCRNAGLVQDWMCDPADIRSRALGGRARIVGPAPDIGAYEAGFDATRVLIR